MAAAADDDMIVQRDAQPPCGISEVSRDRDILAARFRISAGVIVDHPYGPHNVLIYMIYFA